jgi:hypothetical protein
MRHAPDAAQVAERQAEQFIDIDDTLPAAPAAAEPEGASSSDDAANAAPAAVASLAARPAAVVPRVASSSQLEPAADAPEAVAAAGTGVTAQNGETAAPERKIDLGLDGHFFLGPPSVMLPRVQSPEVRRHRPDPQQRLNDALAAADVQRGLARGNEFVGSLNSAVREDGPVRGEAMFRVTVGADGGLLSAELVHGSESEWSSALKSFRALAARRHLRVPPGAHGLRVTFSVKAKVQRPSGKEVEASSVGVAEPSLKPNGMTLHGDFDLADLGGGGQRLVYARVVSEEVL